MFLTSIRTIGLALAAVPRVAIAKMVVPFYQEVVTKKAKTRVSITIAIEVGGGMANWGAKTSE